MQLKTANSFLSLLYITYIPFRPEKHPNFVENQWFLAKLLTPEILDIRACPNSKKLLRSELLGSSTPNQKKNARKKT